MHPRNCVYISTLFVLIIAEFGQCAPPGPANNSISNSSVYNKLIELTTNQKCPYLQNTELLQKEPSFLQSCNNFDHVQHTRFTMTHIESILCLLYYDTYEQLCNSYNKDEGLLKKLIGPASIKQAKEQTVEVVCKQLVDFYKNYGTDTEMLSKNMTQNGACERICTDFDDTVQEACSLSALMANTHNQLLMQLNPPVFGDDKPRVSIAKPSVTEQHSQSRPEKESDSDRVALLHANNGNTNIAKDLSGATMDSTPIVKIVKPGIETLSALPAPVQRTDSSTVQSAESPQEAQPIKDSIQSNKKHGEQLELAVNQEQKVPPVPAEGDVLVAQAQPVEQQHKHITPNQGIDHLNENQPIPKKESPSQSNNLDYDREQNVQNIAIANGDENYDTEDEETQNQKQAPIKEDTNQAPVHGIKPISTNEDEESLPNDSYFFSYFMLFCIIFVAGYVGYHNKQKLLALVLEGRRGRRQQRRRPNSANYHKLDSNLEEAVTSSCDKTSSNVIY